jgi:Flp pilus assembly pilin Flp
MQIKIQYGTPLALLRMSLHQAGKSTPEGTQMNTMFLKLYVKFQDLKDREDGQTMVEYGLLAALISLAAATLLPQIAGSLRAIFGNISTNLANA